MENVVLTVHLILALLLIGVVLLQRSEGGGLGMGGGGNGVMTGRQAANALSRATWGLAGGFIITSIALTIIAAGGAGGRSVVDRLGGSSAPAPAAPAGNLPTLPRYAPPPGSGQPVLPPSPAGSAAPAETPASAPAASAPAAPATTAPAPAAAVPASTAPTPATGQATAPAADANVTRKTVPIGTPASN